MSRFKCLFFHDWDTWKVVSCTKIYWWKEEVNCSVQIRVCKRCGIIQKKDV